MKIKEIPSKKEVELALEGGRNAMWELISTLEGDEQFIEMKHLIKNGVNFNFNIEKVIRGHVIEYPDTNNVKIKGYTKFDLNEYWDEMRYREKLMKLIIRECIDDSIDGQEEWEEMPSG